MLRFLVLEMRSTYRSSGHWERSSCIRACGRGSTGEQSFVLEMEGVITKALVCRRVLEKVTYRNNGNLERISWARGGAARMSLPGISSQGGHAVQVKRRKKREGKDVVEG